LTITDWMYIALACAIFWRSKSPGVSPPRVRSAKKNLTDGRSLGRLVLNEDVQFGSTPQSDGAELQLKLTPKAAQGSLRLPPEVRQPVKR
jgi:hypothetical protein